MVFWRLVMFVFAASILAEAKLYQQRRRDAIPNICDSTNGNGSNVQCYCAERPRSKDITRSAECHLTKKNVEPDDKSWDNFERLKNVTKLTLSNTKGIALNYVPTNALKLMQILMKVEIKYGNIEKIESFAFANLSLIEEITLSDNQIKVLAVNAFANHRDLIILGLDTNNIVEINRNVFVNLPSLEKLFLTNNKITTIHDRAFIHLENLIELEIDRNSLFSLNSETFSGLNSLEKLDLSGNNLEVIGDNTFLPLNNLKTLNLEGNKIQMLDEKAFHGLSKLYSLSLAHNNLTNIENVKIFEGLPALTLVSFKSNQLVELKSEVMAPIINNLYGNTGNLDVEDNKFPCDCRLDWFLILLNRTQNTHLKIAMENFKCIPSDSLREQWMKVTELEKTTPGVADESQAQNPDYEYYDEAQLNGKLFFVDVRDLANCHTPGVYIPPSENEVNTEPLKPSSKASHTTKDAVIIPERKTTSKNTPSISPSFEETKAEDDVIQKPNNDNETKNNKDSFTTVRLATVSAKPLENKNEIIDQDMASDEARPERIKAHRSIQDRNEMSHSNAQANISSVVIVAIMICFRL